MNQEILKRMQLRWAHNASLWNTNALATVGCLQTGDAIVLRNSVEGAGVAHLDCH